MVITSEGVYNGDVSPVLGYRNASQKPFANCDIYIYIICINIGMYIQAVKYVIKLFF